MAQVAEEVRKVQSKGSNRTEETHVNEEVYLYKDSGIRERHGAVPIWLQLVAYGLFIWGIYYTIKYW